MRAVAAAFALVAIACITVAIVGMVTGRPGDRAGTVIRIVAVLCFVATVVLNIAAH